MVTSSSAARLFLPYRRAGRSWRIRSCYHPQRHLRSVSASASAPAQSTSKPYYVTTPIFYVNAEPHVGHLYTTILADVLKRWAILKGDTQASLLTGTDEHGMKVQKAAEGAGLTPKALCDKNATQFQDLCQRAQINYDRFIRTTDPDHKIAVEHFWKELRHKDYIYESKHEGWYSVSDETFYPESQVHLILDPSSGRKYQASKETGKEVEWTSEINYHFRLSAFQDRLLQHYEKNPDFVVPVQRFNFVKKEVEGGLLDLSVSRPRSRLTWGIPVPEDESQTIYVWLDALINYLTMTGYPWRSTEKRNQLWPPNVQVIGKDIVRFHTIYWPAFLMALDLPLPKTFLTHAHWTMNRAKMSKSSGNGVNPFAAIHRYGLDAIRYFMVHDGGIVDDASYDNSFIVERYKKGLQGGLGNLFTRMIRSFRWDIYDSIMAMKGRKLSSLYVDFVERTVQQVHAHMDTPDPRAALHAIMSIVYEANRAVMETPPWDLAKYIREHQGSKEHELMFHKIIYTTVETVRISAIMLQAFMPQSACQILDQLKVDVQHRGLSYARIGADFSYGQNAMQEKPKRDRTQGLLFPPLISEF